VPDDDARATIRAFWERDVQGLRDRHNRERLDRGQSPIQNREIAKTTGIPPTTLSDWLTGKRAFIPDWDRFEPIIACLGGTADEWLPKWRRAKAAYDNLGKAVPPAAQPDQPSQPAPTMRPGESRWSRRAWILVIACAAVVIALTAGGMWLLSHGSAADAVQPATGVSGARCLRIRDGTLSVSVFKDPVGHDRWTEWPATTRFWADGDTSSPPRYRVPLTNGAHGYVGKDPRWVQPATDCR
jgi:transcriptional regulator with XRE-family HTH domain